MASEQDNGYQTGSEGSSYYQNNTVPNGAPFGFNPPPEDTEGKNAKTFGIVSLVVSFVCCQLIGLILGIVAITKANHSRSQLGFLTGDASTGRTLGIISIVYSAISAISSVFAVILFMQLGVGISDLM